MDIGDWITLTAILVALGLGVSSLIQTQLLRKKERRERLLTEIIEWATNSVHISWEFGTAFKEALKPMISREQQLSKFTQIAEVKEHLMQFAGRNVYITALALGVKKHLQEAISKLDKDLANYILFLDNWQRDLLISIETDKADREENTKKLMTLFVQ